MINVKRKTSSKSTEKTNTLRKSGSLNPRPDKVKDEQFAGSGAFFDVRDLIQVKYEMLRRVQKDGWSVTKAAKLFGFSRPSFYEAKDSFEKRGIPGLQLRTRGPKGPHKLTDEALVYLEAELKINPKKSPEELGKLLADQFNIKINSRSVGRALNRCKKKADSQKRGQYE